MKLNKINLDALTREINLITQVFECGDESRALKIIRAMNSNPTFLNDVKLDNIPKNEEFVKAFDGLSKFEDKINTEFSKFYILLHNRSENARNTLNA